MIDLNTFTEHELNELERLIDRSIKICYESMAGSHQFLKDSYKKDIETYVIIKAKLVNNKNNN